jgi:hypothetical protein
VRVIRGFGIERLPQALQFKNQRGALRPDALAARLAGRALRGGVVMLRAFSRPHH